MGYSCRSASIGSRSAARLAGHRPNTSPTAALKTNASTSASTVTAVRHPAAFDSAQAAPAPGGGSAISRRRRRCRANGVGPSAARGRARKRRCGKLVAAFRRDRRRCGAWAPTEEPDEPRREGNGNDDIEKPRDVKQARDKPAQHRADQSVTKRGRPAHRVGSGQYEPRDRADQETGAGHNQQEYDDPHPRSDRLFHDRSGYRWGGNDSKVPDRAVRAAIAAGARESYAHNHM